MEDPRYSTYSAIIDRPELRWPDNARVALWVDAVSVKWHARQVDGYDAGAIVHA